MAEPKEDEVEVKYMASPINPADINILQGKWVCVCVCVPSNAFGNLKVCVNLYLFPLFDHV